MLLIASFFRMCECRKYGDLSDIAQARHRVTNFPGARCPVGRTCHPEISLKSCQKSKTEQLLTACISVFFENELERTLVPRNLSQGLKHRPEEIPKRGGGLGRAERSQNGEKPRWFFLLTGNISNFINFRMRSCYGFHPLCSIWNCHHPSGPPELFHFLSG